MLNVKEASWKVILVYLVTSLCMSLLINLVLFPNSFFTPIAKATAYLINPTLQANLLLLLVFSLIVFGWGKLRPADVGLEWHKLARGIELVVAVWLVARFIVLFISAIGGIGPDSIESSFARVDTLGSFISQLLGSALLAEMTYRGFYLSQFYLKIKRGNEYQRQAWAILCMAGLSVLFYIPDRIQYGMHLSQMPLIPLFFEGLYFALLYLLSGNLFYTIGIHTLVNQPDLITHTIFPGTLLIRILGLLLLLILQLQKDQSTSELNPAS